MTPSPTWRSKEAQYRLSKKHPDSAKAYLSTCHPLLPLQLPLLLTTMVLAEAFTHQAQRGLTVLGIAVDMGHRVDTAPTLQ